MSPTTDTIESVLLPTDGSDGALVGAKRGADLAAMADATVHVLSVVDASAIEGVASVLESDLDEQRAALEDDAESAVASVSSMVQDRYPDCEVTTTTDRGRPFRVIDRYVEENDIDVVAMGTKGRTGVRRVVLGSVTENVLRTVEAPILVVPPAASDAPLTEDTVRNVLLPTDGSDGAAVAVDWGLALATAFDAMTHAIYSVDTRRFSPQAEPGEILAELERPGEDALESVRERARERGCSLTGTIATGPPARVVLDYADGNDIDLIAMGTHGRSGLERHFLGSVTENVVRNAELPVVCVPMSGA
ncbi:universal stress protein [Natrinema saccharevitans]|uniref:Universal stress protein n=1 Tax=Natrinema saccharevitans TaxID=301967 RepID=A0A1S8AWQ1_9EURY|nr:universal stress protein [Natrinema saccharevitans]OLZ40784.1 universal stress protein [Natrinema saccharevitans]